MKNKKTILGSSAAIVAAVALIGGGTFANWSDFAEVKNSNAQAGALVLNAEHATAINTEQTGLLAPGENKLVYKYVANRSDNTTALQDAQLDMTVFNVRDYENECSSNGEAFAEGTSEANAAVGNYDAATACGGVGPSAGELSDEAWMQIAVKPVGAGIDSPADCASHGVSGSTSRQQMTLADWGTYGAKSLGTLDPEQGLCLVFEFGLPNGQGSSTSSPGIDFAGGAVSTNASQGDSAEFDLRFDLTQVVN